MPRHYQPWSRADYDRLEQLIRAGHTYAEIDTLLGRKWPGSAEAAARRIGLNSDRGRGNRRKDWPVIDPIIRDCIECQLMTVPQVANYLTALGHAIKPSTVYARIAPDTVLNQRARRNGTRRRIAVADRINRRRAQQKRAA